MDLPKFPGCVCASLCSLTRPQCMYVAYRHHAMLPVAPHCSAPLKLGVHRSGLRQLVPCAHKLLTVDLSSCRKSFDEEAHATPSKTCGISRKLFLVLLVVVAALVVVGLGVGLSQSGGSPSPSPSSPPPPAGNGPTPTMPGGPLAAPGVQHCWHLALRQRLHLSHSQLMAFCQQPVAAAAVVRQVVQQQQLLCFPQQRQRASQLWLAHLHTQLHLQVALCRRRRRDWSTVLAGCCCRRAVDLYWRAGTAQRQLIASCTPAAASFPGRTALWTPRSVFVLLKNCLTGPPAPKTTTASQTAAKKYKVMVVETFAHQAQERHVVEMSSVPYSAHVRSVCESLESSRSAYVVELCKPP